MAPKTNTTTMPSTSAIVRMGKILVAQKLSECGHRLAGTAEHGGTCVSASLDDVVQTILVRTNFAPKPSGGTGKPALDWWFPLSTKADYVAFADMSEKRVWLIRREDALRLAQQKGSAKGNAHLYMHLDDVATTAGHERTHVNHFSEFLLRPQDK